MVPEDNYLDRFYGFLAEDNKDAILAMGIPRSEVFYIRAAVEARTGVKYPLRHIEKQIKEFIKHG